MISNTNFCIRYFTSNDTEATELNAAVFKEHAEYRARLSAWFGKFGGTAGTTNRGRPISVFIKADAPIPEGMKDRGLCTIDSVQVREIAPVGNTKVGKAIKKEMLEVGGFEASKIILEHYKACRRQIWGDSSMWCSVGHTTHLGAPITLSIPVNDENPLSAPPSGFREIKKSEYIAITEES